MSGRGKGGKGKGSAKRHRRQESQEHPVQKNGFRRLARKAGVKRISSDCYGSLHSFGSSYLTNLLEIAVVYARNAKRKTISNSDVVHAAKRFGLKLVGW